MACLGGLAPLDELTGDLRDRLDDGLRDIGFGRLVGVEVVDWEPGRATTRLVPGANQTNVHGFVHGGALFALADTAFEVACNSYGRVCVGLDVTVHYAAPAQPGKALVAEAVEASRSRRVASYRVEVKGEDGLVRCTALAVAFRTDRWHLGEEEWPPDWRAAH
jgi:phenylacetic acid degradation protein PaaD